MVTIMGRELPCAPQGDIPWFFRRDLSRSSRSLPWGVISTAQAMINRSENRDIPDDHDESNDPNVESSTDGKKPAGRPGSKPKRQTP